MSWDRPLLHPLLLFTVSRRLIYLVIFREYSLRNLVENVKRFCFNKSVVALCLRVYRISKFSDIILL